MASDTLKARPERIELVMALSTIALGLVILAGSFSIDLGAGYDRIGPRFFPYLVAFGLLVSGSFLARDALRREPPVQVSASRKALWILGVALVSSALLLERAGFIPTATLLFWLVARAFESRRPWRDAGVGLALAIVVYLAFTRGLGLALPRGFF